MDQEESVFKDFSFVLYRPYRSQSFPANPTQEKYNLLTQKGTYEYQYPALR